MFIPSSLGGLPETEITIANLLKTKGYLSKLVGKWHIGHNNALPTQRGFLHLFLFVCVCVCVCLLYLFDCANLRVLFWLLWCCMVSNKRKKIKTDRI